MKIITIPHPTLRQKAAEVASVTPELIRFIGELENTLRAAKNPKGIALAAPQVDKLWRAFATQQDGEMRTLLNPRIIDRSNDQTFGPDKKKPYLEGCLSMPGLYGPVPRWHTIQLRYELVVGKELVSKTETFEDFAARVVQHEIDHLDGILFTDYGLELDLPIYQEVVDEKDLIEADRQLLTHLTQYQAT